MTPPDTTAGPRAATSGTLPLRALAEPALVGEGAPLATACARLRLARGLERVASHLTELLGRGVSLTPLERASPGAALGWSFSAPDGARALLTLDADAARLVVDGLEQRVLGLRGVGELTDTELGLIEFLLLEGLAALAAQEHLSFALEGPIPRRELETGTPPGLVALHLAVEAEGRRGTACLWLPAPPPLRALAFPEPRSGDVRAQGVGKGLWCTLALPPVALDADEGRALVPGAVLLTGVGELGGGAPRPALVTETGWNLGSVRVIDDAATLTTVELLASEPAAHVLPAAEAGRELVLPTLGWVRIDVEAAGVPAPGERIALAHDERGAVLLHAPGGTLRGELVRVGAELGVRVLP